ncbi:SDR family NAD(P)-dependent oxidoreductase [Roseibium sp. MMSF_3544]|uniref:SDR family NAD(P)-dependent oxidoreductase n=1 Tax=unclassified Roseibium TaxID=2629323 RepID=UPI00273FE98B|nr:SDR family NAD(P)-dependent oxidoreductase [Roseibium sp. MMSF_3544]
MKTVLVTGSSRGLGLEFCRQYKADGWTVLATCRTPQTSESLQTLGVEIFQLDTASVQSAHSLAARLAGRRIDVLINNAGVMGDNARSALDADLDDWEEAFRINALGPAIITRALLENLTLSDAPVGVTMGSQAGIFDMMKTPKLAIYRSTKAAAHAVTISLARALEQHGVLYFSLRPGRTKTDITGHTGDYEADDSVRLMRGLIDRADPAWRGLFVDRSGAVYNYGGGFHA